jgi:hypothetical protein
MVKCGIWSTGSRVKEGKMVKYGEEIKRERRVMKEK